MKNDAEAAAAKDGVNLTVAAGSSDGDTQTQIGAIDNAINASESRSHIRLLRRNMFSPWISDGEGFGSNEGRVLAGRDTATFLGLVQAKFRTNPKRPVFTLRSKAERP